MQVLQEEHQVLHLQIEGRTEWKSNKGRQIRDRGPGREMSHCRDIIRDVIHHHELTVSWSRTSSQWFQTWIRQGCCISFPPHLTDSLSFFLPPEILFPGQGRPQVWQVQCWCECKKLLAIKHVGLSITEDYKGHVVSFIMSLLGSQLVSHVCIEPPRHHHQTSCYTCLIMY